MEFMNKISAWSDSLVKLNTATQMGFLTSLSIPTPSIFMITFLQFFIILVIHQNNSY